MQMGLGFALLPPHHCFKLVSAPTSTGLFALHLPTFTYLSIPVYTHPANPPGTICGPI